MTGVPVGITGVQHHLALSLHFISLPSCWPVFLSLEDKASNCFLIAEAALGLEAILVIGAQFSVLVS